MTGNGESEMSSESTVVDEGALTLVWKTLGLKDQAIDEARTLTMRSDFNPGESTPGDLVMRLPPLLRTGDSSTLPELKIKGTLGEGGMGLVELAEQLSLGRDVAVKKVRHDSRSERTTLVLLREGWTTGLLEHPNIVPVYTLGRNDEDEPVIVMKKISGTSWLDIFADPTRTPDAFDAADPIELHVEVLIQVCNAVHYAHSRGIIHRDLKPENVMLGSFGEVYVLDWGIAVSLREDPTGRLAHARDVDQPAGTPAYMAPEMVEGNGEKLGVHTDVFLLGAILHEALTGRPPYDGSTLFGIMLTAHECKPPVFDDTVPPQLAAICRRAMSKDPTDRFESARAFRDALLDYRRHRQAHRLVEKGDTRYGDVRRLLDGEERGEVVDETQLYKTFGECRFAYEQSLEITPANAGAVEGMQRVLEAMANRALERNAYKAASLLIADFPHPNDDFGRRLQALQEKLDEREEEYEELQKIRHDVDVDVGRGSRTLFMLIMGGFWTVLSFGLAFAIEKSLLVLTYPRMFSHIVILTITLAGVIYIGRDRFFDNEVNRRLLFGALALFVGATFLRGTSWILDLPKFSAMTMEVMMYGIGCGILAVTVDKRLLLGGFPFIIAALGGAIWPDLLFWLFASANTTAAALLIFIWWPRDPFCETTRSLLRR